MASPIPREPLPLLPGPRVLRVEGRRPSVLRDGLLEPADGPVHIAPLSRDPRGRATRTAALRLGERGAGVRAQPVVQRVRGRVAP